MEVQNSVNVSSFVPRTLEEKKKGHFYHLLSGIRQTLSHNVVSSSPRLSGVRTHIVSGDR